MNSIQRIEANEHWSAVLERIASGQEIVLTSNGQDVAKVIPAPVRDVSRIRASIDALIKFGHGRSLNGLQIKVLVNEGRKY